MCDLSDPRILETYTAITEEGTTNWLILGYNDTRDVISLYSQGTGGLSEFRDHLSDEVLYGFVRVDDRFILITWVSEQVSGVRRARALVHSRSVASLLKLHNAQITASTLNDLSDANIRTRLKLGDGQLSSRKSSSSLSQKRASRSLQSPSSPVPPPIQQPQQKEDEFVEANETLTPSTPVVANQLVQEPRENDASLELQQQKEQQEQAEKERLLAKQQQQQEEQEKKRQEQERQTALFKQKEQERQAALAAAAAEKEAKRVAAEKEAAAKRSEEERKLKEKMEAERLAEEKKALQRKLLEAEKNKDIILSGFVSVQPSTSPFWRRRYFVIKGKSMALYRDELNPNPVTVLDLSSVVRLNNVNVDIETFVPNAFVLETKQNGSYQLFADDKKELETILTALQTVI
ncbi:uncharacterized protein B0P05DRAFT_522244 [Gilbertella persicaria]|nr:uncharacterized protein B0P05DRAFT_522244 [Gilbertella persicaria]KAI8097829.1 hypothetical protein B0P05DRAFT_522244 [Gilbertella persicaria]